MIWLWGSALSYDLGAAGTPKAPDEHPTPPFVLWVLATTRPSSSSSPICSYVDEEVKAPKSGLSGRQWQLQATPETGALVLHPAGLLSHEPAPDSDKAVPIDLPGASASQRARSTDLFG